MDLLEETPEVFFDVLMPIIDIAETATYATEAEMRAQIHSRFSRVCDAGIISAAAPGVAPWQHPPSDAGGSGEGAKAATNPVDNGAPFARDTNVD